MKRVTTRDNFAKALPSGPQPTGIELEVPVVSLASIVIPYGFKAEVEDVDIDEPALQDMLEKKLASVADDLAAQVEDALKKALMSSVWAWSDGRRDIFDTGQLANSGKVVVGSSGLEVVYTAPYAAIVHNGGYIHPYGNVRARPIYLPGRPWIKSVLYGEGPVPRFDFEGFFDSKFG